MAPEKQLQKLSKMHRLFVEAFCGCPMEAAQIAGFGGTLESLRATGNRLLSDPLVLEAIKERSRYLNKMGNAIAVKDERQMFWTSIMNNKDPHHMVEKDSNGIDIPEGNIGMNMRLKASELLGKSEGDFVERLDITGTVSISDVIKESYDINDKSLEDIEAEYMEVRSKKKDDTEDTSPPLLENYTESIYNPEEEEIPTTTISSIGDLI